MVITMKISVRRTGSYSCFCLRVYLSAWKLRKASVSPSPGANALPRQGWTRLEVVRITCDRRVAHDGELLFLAMGKRTQFEES
jgi:hypothetical protein